MRSPKTNGLKTRENQYPGPARHGVTGATDRNWRPLPLLPEGASPEQHMDWLVLAVLSLEARAVYLHGVTDLHGERLDQLGKSVTELRRMLVICFVIVALGATVGAVRSWFGV